MNLLGYRIKEVSAAEFARLKRKLSGVLSEVRYSVGGREYILPSSLRFGARGLAYTVKG
jgi:hypothetical protein